MANKKVVFKYGTRQQYDAVLGGHNPDYLYFIEDTGEIYKGDVALARGNHYEAIRATDETDSLAITRALGGNTPLQDDICVIKTLIAADKYSYTSFIYDGQAWKAMDGNYDAENVYFDQDLTFTHEVGYVSLTNGQATVPSRGKNVKEVFEYLFAKEQDPKITNPSVSVSSSTAKAYEVGTKVTPVYTATFNAGSYEFGPATDLEATWSVTDGATTLTTATGTFSELTVEDNTSYTITATATYGTGATPISNLGNEKPDLAIAAGSVSGKSGAITGYRNMFVGATAGTEELTSAIIRGLEGSRAQSKNVSYAANKVAGASRVIVAIPATSSVNVKKVIMPSAQNAEVTGEFVKQANNISVEGANGATAVPYKVWVYQPASLDSSETYTITIG